MITNFEDITFDLTSEEKKLIPLIINGFKNTTPLNPIKADMIIPYLNNYLKENDYKIRVTDARFRKCVNYIRVNSLLPLIATSRGYYVSYDKVEIEKQVLSLHERASAIIKAADGLKTFING